MTEGIAVIGCLLTVLFLFKSRKFFGEIGSNLSLLIGLSTSDLKIKYAGAYLGVVWAFVQPILTTFIYWFVFQIGFRSAPVDDFPFILWLVTGLIPWFYFSDVVISGTGSMQEYSYLVKKVMFKVDIIPMVKVLSCFFVHLVFMVFIFLLYGIYGVPITEYTLQLLYYSICVLALSTGIVYITATLNVFVKDTMQFVSVTMQLLFWMTPIVWMLDIMPEPVQKVLVFNPFCYIVAGYRDSLIDQVWFWEKGSLTICFWTITSLSILIGSKLFRRLKIHFADVL